MTAARWEVTTGRHPPGDVLAVLVDDASALDVASAAVGEGARRRARVRFTQLVDESLDPAARARSQRRTFVAALRALRQTPLVATSFDVLLVDPARPHDIPTTDVCVVVAASADPAHEHPPALSTWPPTVPVVWVEHRSSHSAGT